MVVVGELAGWRRTHFAREVTPSLDGQGVTVFGWVGSVRRQGGITFLLLYDRTGELQVAVRRGAVPEPVVRVVEEVREHSSLGVRGVVRAIDKAPRGAEVVPEEVRVLSVPERQPPFKLFARRLPRIDKRLEVRAIDLRRPRARAIFQVRAEVLKAVRDFLDREGFLEVNTPKIIASATEGGAALFPLLYYDKEAFLTQSPQLFKEQLVMPFERVYEIGPAFRAEPSRTLEHISEFVSIDIEAAYLDYQGVMEVLDRLVHHVVNWVEERCQEELGLLEVDLDRVDGEFPRYTYEEVLELLRRKGLAIEWGEDLSSQALDLLGGELAGYYFITDWPTQAKPFYIAPRQDRPELSESFDFMKGGVELASGGTRISSKARLVERLEAQGLNPKSFEFHLRVFDYGMPPHAGWGLGLERFLMALLKVNNIREVTLYPRDQYHLTP